MSRRVTRGFDPVRLSRLRQNAGYSRPDLARIANIGAATLYQWETGASSPQVDKLARVVGVLDAEMSDVVLISEDERFPGDWRVLAGLLQPELGLRAGVSTSTVANVERGQIALTDSTAQKLAHALGIAESTYRAAYARARARPPGSGA